MKKLIPLFLILSACTLNSAFAKDYTTYCSTKTATKTPAGMIGSLTGVNAIKRNIAESQIKNALEKKTGAKFKVEASSFYGINPTSGPFKGLKLTGDGVNYNGLYVTNISANTICPYNEVKYEDKTLKFMENSVMEFNAEISETDLNKTLNGSNFAKFVDKINSDKAVSSLLKIENYNVKIKDDKLVFNYGISMLPKNKGILAHLPVKLDNFNLAFSSGLGVKDGEIKLLDFGLNNNQLNYGFLLPIINKFNPTSWSIKPDKSFIGDGQLDINSVTIKNSKIIINGALIAKAEV